MSQERLPVRKIREVLRLKNEGFSNRAIARVCKVSNSTVCELTDLRSGRDNRWNIWKMQYYARHGDCSSNCRSLDGCACYQNPVSIQVN